MEGQPFNATGVSEVWGLLGGSNQSALYCDFEALPFKTCWDYHRTGVTTNGWYKAYLGGTTHTIYCDFNEHTSDEAGKCSKFSMQLIFQNLQGRNQKKLSFCRHRQSSYYPNTDLQLHCQWLLPTYFDEQNSWSSHSRRSNEVSCV